MPASGQVAGPNGIPPNGGPIFAPPPVGPAVVPPTTNLSAPTNLAPATPYSNASQTPATYAGGSPGATVQTKPQAFEECEVIARFDGQVVQACEILWQVNQLIEANADQIPPEQEAEVRKMLMQRQLLGLIDTKLLYSDFRRNVPAENLSVIFEKLQTPFEEKQVPRLMERFEATDIDDLGRKLFALGSSLRDMRQAFREQAVSQEWLRSKIQFNKEVTHNEMLAYYREHSADYEFPTQAKWEELMVRRTKFSSRNEAVLAICEMGNDVYKTALAKQQTGPVFGEVAKAKSHGFSAANGGMRDWTTLGALKETAIDKAIFSLAIGQMSDVIETSNGFHIVRVLERKEAGRTPFTEVQKKIVEAIKEDRYRVAVDEYLKEIRSKARIWTVYTGDISYEMLAAPPQEPGAPQRR